MYSRTEMLYEQKKNINILMQEGLQGVTKRDVLPNTAPPLEGEIEAMYFNELRMFLKTSIAARCMSLNQDLCGGK